MAAKFEISHMDASDAVEAVLNRETLRHFIKCLLVARKEKPGQQLSDALEVKAINGLLSFVCLLFFFFFFFFFFFVFVLQHFLSLH